MAQAGGPTGLMGASEFQGKSLHGFSLEEKVPAAHLLWTISGIARFRLLGRLARTSFFVAERYETGSLAVTSNLEFSRWEETFGDAAMTTALLDRLTHHCTVLLFQGESYRFRESARRQQDEVAKMKTLVNQAS